MANVLIDKNVMCPWDPPTGSQDPVLHGSSITAVDSSDPSEEYRLRWTAAAARTAGDYITITGSGFTSLDVTVLFWNSRQSLWFQGDSRTFTALGQHALAVEVRGSFAFLKVTAFSGTSFSLNADSILS